MKVITKTFQLAGLLLAASFALAQEGPQVPPCDGCPASLTERPYPRPGMWWDPARNGTGMNLEAQNGVIVGTWHGFDEDGSPVWYQFSAALERVAANDEGYWRAEAPLVEFAGGNCIDCPYRPSEVAGERGTIELIVLQRNLISYRIDGGETFRMQPLVWGTPMPKIIPDAADIGLPMFPDDQMVSEWALGAGLTPWVLITRMPDPPNRGYLTSSVVLWASSGTSVVSAPYALNFFYPAGPSLDAPANLECGSFATDQMGTIPESLRARLGSEPACVLRRVVGAGVSQYYASPLGNVGDDYFILTAEDGSVIEGHRLLYR
jgi:hypothetical protein